mmetsp:Transcript_118744/g.343435  ORF Transcript_118744/g.343435 Transcript_118744/m.343435 type:complete len:233 (-) Transcript_118744:2999-3697(-)
MDQLSKIFNTVDIVVGRRRDESDTRFTGTKSSNVLRNLGSRKLTTFARLCTLCHLNFELLGSDQKLRGDSETATGDLVDERVGRVAILQTSQVGEGGTTSLFVNIGQRLSTHCIFTTFSRVRLSTNTVDSNGKIFVGFSTQGTKGHGSSTETTHNRRGRLDFINGNARPVGIKLKKITDVGKRSGFKALSKDFVIGNVLGLDTVVFEFISVRGSTDTLVESNSVMKQLGKVR